MVVEFNVVSLTEVTDKPLVGVDLRVMLKFCKPMRRTPSIWKSG